VRVQRGCQGRQHAGEQQAARARWQEADDAFDIGGFALRRQRQPKLAGHRQQHEQSKSDWDPQQRAQEDLRGDEDQGGAAGIVVAPAGHGALRQIARAIAIHLREPLNG
jgi:hypothetical protein